MLSMSDRILTNLPKTRTYQCKQLNLGDRLQDRAGARHEGIFGFDQKVFSSSTVALVGAGGINGEIGEGLVRKGIGELLVFDGDTVDITNLNRQRFSDRDLEKNKALALAKNLQDEGFMGSRITGYAGYIQEFEPSTVLLNAHLIVCGVDNDRTRVYLAKLGLERRLPIVFTAVSRDANQGYVFVQVPEGPCFGCLFPGAITDETYTCPGAPAIKDILKLVAGMVLYATDTVLMNRQRQWNFRMVQLAGFMEDEKRWATKLEACKLCGPIKRETLG